MTMGRTTHSARSSLLTFACDGCRRDVSGSRKAAIHHRYADHDKARREQQEWDREHTREDGFMVLTGSDLLSYPEPARWLVHCDDCNPHKDEDGVMCSWCYWFSLDRCRTAFDLLDWTAHLMEKDWLVFTNWDRFLYRVLAASRAQVAA